MATTTTVRMIPPKKLQPSKPLPEEGGVTGGSVTEVGADETELVVEVVVVVEDAVCLEVVGVVGEVEE